MSDNFAIGAFAQDIYKVSGTKAPGIMLGQKRLLPDGRVFRYAKAGGTLVAGEHCIMAVGVANHIKQIQSSGATNAAGKTEVSVYVGATAVTANQYDDGWLHIYDGAAGTVGFQYRIKSHTVSAAGSAIITVQLATPILVATVTTDTFSLLPNPWSGVTHSTTAESGPAGISMRPASSGQYLWLQTGDVACGYTKGTPAVGSKLTIGTTAGQAAIDNAYTTPLVGFVWGYNGVDAKFCPQFLQID